MINGLEDDKAFVEAMGVLAWSNVATTLLVHPDTASVRLQVDEIPKGAYGEAKNALCICINKSLLADPARMAIVIVHELTHCLDFKYTGEGALREGGRGWASEINAHFNQGLVMREVHTNMSPGYSLRGAFDAMANSNTTFGNSKDWDTRRTVAKAIRVSYESLAMKNDTSFTTDDAKWKKTGGLHYFPVETVAY